jgi:hypothetical protein
MKDVIVAQVITTYQLKHTIHPISLPIEKIGLLH